jgi:hypothetical protein
MIDANLRALEFDLAVFSVLVKAAVQEKKR